MALGSHPSGISAFVKRQDLRLLLLGSLLPDIIDKPVGHFFFRETLSNGRIYSHTLLFLLIISLGGYLLYRRGHLWLVTLAIGTFWHLILDEIWLSPRTLLWPFFGTAFQKLAIDNLLTRWLYGLLHNPPGLYPGDSRGAGTRLVRAEIAAAKIAPGLSQNRQNKLRPGLTPSGNLPYHLNAKYVRIKDTAHG